MCSETNRYGETFDPLGAAARQYFGLSCLYPYQRLVMANILEAAEAAGAALRWPGEAASQPEAGEPDSSGPRDSPGRQIVILPTGAGKSLCFQLPAILLNGPTLVIYPLLSLMADQERRLLERNIPALVLRGGQSREEREALWARLRSGECRIIIANPEVLLSPPVFERLGSLGIVHLVIDEAHCVSEWGEQFRPSYLEIRRIISAAAGPSKQDGSGERRLPLITAFTATAGAPVLEKIERYIFGERGARRIAGNPDRNNISYAARGCILREPAVRDLLRVNSRPALVFCSSRLGTERLARYLRGELADQEIRFYHAGLSAAEKTAVENWFLPNSRGILVCTCAYGMGVDKADIRTVIHRDCPPSVEAYLQESGRAGRDRLQSKAILLWGPDDQAARRFPGERRRGLLDYARNTGVCRRTALLTLLRVEGGGESGGPECCDVCAGLTGGELREVPALQKFFRRNARRYTLAEAAALLSQNGHPGWSEEEADRALRQLLEAGAVRESKNPLWYRRLYA